MTSKADSTSNAGNAILYECVRTILTLNVTAAHHIEAASILGKFLQNTNSDMRFVSLSLLLQARDRSGVSPIDGGDRRLHRGAPPHRYSELPARRGPVDPPPRAGAGDRDSAAEQRGGAGARPAAVPGGDQGEGGATRRGVEDHVAGAAVRAVVHVAGGHAAVCAQDER